MGTSDLLLQEQQNSSTDSSKNYIIGDLMVLASACFYSASNVGGEFMVKTRDWKEYLGYLGLWGSIISIIQLVVVERDELYHTDWSLPNIALLLTFVLALVLMYILTSIFLLHGDAAMFDLSLLTSDVWAVIASYVLFQSPPSLWYFIAFIVIVIGLGIYSKQPGVTRALFHASTDSQIATLDEKTPPAPAQEGPEVFLLVN